MKLHGSWSAMFLVVKYAVLFILVVFSYPLISRYYDTPTGFFIKLNGVGYLKLLILLAGCYSIY